MVHTDRPDHVRFTKRMRDAAYRAGQRDQQREMELAQLSAEWAYEVEVERVKRRQADTKHNAQQRVRQLDQ